MKVVICGAGLVGTSIAKHLAGENNDVTVVDQDYSLVRRIGAVSYTHLTLPTSR